MSEQMFERDQHLKADPYKAQPELHVAAAYRVAAMYAGSSPENSEQLSDAMWGLVKAASRYKPDFVSNGQRVRFISYAYRGMQNEILEGHRQRKGFIPQGGKRKLQVFSVDEVGEKTIPGRDDEPNPNADALGLLAKVLDTLEEPYRSVIDMRLNGMVHREIAEVIGRTKQRSQQLEQKALQMMRDAFRKLGIEDIEGKKVERGR